MQCGFLYFTLTYTSMYGMDLVFFIFADCTTAAMIFVEKLLYLVGLYEVKKLDLGG